jgi:hypothetical protein
LSASGHKTDITFAANDVRFWHKADIAAVLNDVCFGGKADIARAWVHVAF